MPDGITVIMSDQIDYMLAQLNTMLTYEHFSKEELGVFSTIQEQINKKISRYYKSGVYISENDLVNITKLICLDLINLAKNNANQKWKEPFIKIFIILNVLKITNEKNGLDQIKFNDGNKKLFLDIFDLKKDDWNQLLKKFPEADGIWNWIKKIFGLNYKTKLESNLSWVKQHVDSKNTNEDSKKMNENEVAMIKSNTQLSWGEAGDYKDIDEIKKKEHQEPKNEHENTEEKIKSTYM